MKIMIDGDASPVKNIVIETAADFELPVVIVTSFAHFSNRELPEHVKVVYVDSSAEAADYRIMKLAEKGDVLVTQDYGLASLALGKKVRVLHHKGFEYSDENIGQLLESRYLSAQIRKSGKRTKGPKPFTKEDAENFRNLLTQVLQQ